MSRDGTDEWTDAAPRKGSIITRLITCPEYRLHWRSCDAFAMAGFRVKVYSAAFCRRERVSCGEDHFDYLTSLSCHACSVSKQVYFAEL